MIRSSQEIRGALGGIGQVGIVRLDGFYDRAARCCRMIRTIALARLVLGFIML
jgi:hypothetical protein